MLGCESAGVEAITTNRVRKCNAAGAAVAVAVADDDCPYCPLTCSLFICLPLLVICPNNKQTLPAAIQHLQTQLPGHNAGSE